MANKLQLFIIHCTATPEGRAVTPHEIRQWHLGPKHEPDGSLIYKGKSFPNIDALPNETIGGVSISNLKGRGWSKVGYSDMILLDGTLVNLIPYDDDDLVEPWEISNGALGTNSIARHIVYVGGSDRNNPNSPKDTRTPAQRATLEAWVRTTIKFNPTAKGAGHNQFAQKACPSFNVPAWLESIGIDSKNIYR